MASHKELADPAEYLEALERHLRGSGIPEIEWLDVVHSKMDGYIQSVCGQVIDDWLGYWTGKFCKVLPYKSKQMFILPVLGRAVGLLPSLGTQTLRGINTATSVRSNN